MSEPIRIAADHARRFLVRRHLLAPPRSLPARAASVLTVIDHLGLLQFDPLEVPGARNHDLVLHARIRGYRRGWCERWLYGRDRRLIEVYNKSLNILPMGELPHYALAWDRSGRHYEGTILREQAAVADAIVAQIRSDGPLSTAAFKEHNHAVDWWWAPTSAARAVMEALFVSGRLGIARRDGNRRYYDLIERLVPTELLDAARAGGRCAAPPPAEPLPGGRAAGRPGARRTSSTAPGPSPIARAGWPSWSRREPCSPWRWRECGSCATSWPTSARCWRPTASRSRRRARRHLPGAAGPPGLGSAAAARAVRLRLHLGGVRAGGQAALRLLRAAAPVRRPDRGPHRAAARSPDRPPGDRRHLVRAGLRADGGAALRRRPRHGAAGLPRVRRCRCGVVAAHAAGTRAGEALERQAAAA